MTPKKTLDLRYNAMWNEWNGKAEEFQNFNFEPQVLQHYSRMVLSWKRINVYSAKNVFRFIKPTKTTFKHILCNISGNVESGNLLGIMGPSGSGKTTLMATISHRTKANFEGELFLNGKPVSEKVLIQISGFVPQQDIHFEHLTALEHLTFMAKLKMDRTTSNEKLKDRIDHLVTTIGMNNFLNTKLMYLSGDSYSAAHIVNILKSIARTGKIVVCTIHQPASGVFDLFDDIVLLTHGRLAYQGPVSFVNQFFEKFDYACPDMFNKADYVISILNSDEKLTKCNIDKMCKMSSSDEQIDSNYHSFNNSAQLEYEHLLNTKKPLWITQLKLVFIRSSKSFVRDYKNHGLELLTILFLGLVIATPYGNLMFDTSAVQNWQGFWFSFTINSMFQFCYSSIITYHKEFPIIHREVSNKIYYLSAFYVSEVLISLLWTTFEVFVLIFISFHIVGVGFKFLRVMTFLIIMLTCRTYGSVLSAYFERIETIIMFSLLYDYLTVSLSGAYISFSSIPPLLNCFKNFSLFFLGCEALSILHWQEIPFIPCFKDDCLRNGKEVLLSYGYNIHRFELDLIILLLFYLSFNVLGYYGVLLRAKKQPAY
ncbi:protein scarlet-like isoform X2 [Daktulosphaira vitifoliae]|uniref:protein scarlet-like isoform X2 n=1 Tax=Daktulosphaira vitifoliae TaxID=58002 RepID=UPI0021AA5AB5|nr:protein scarlet-like isoform X2 [Daktulosphaira vitifoliae]